jgi:hypothetical protein
MVVVVGGVVVVAGGSEVIADTPEVETLSPAQAAKERLTTAKRAANRLNVPP